jgi:hypothetical protein
MSKKYLKFFLLKKKIDFEFCVDCNCTGFSAPFTCICGESANKHTTLVENTEEREKRDRPIGYATLYKAMDG